MISSLYLLGVLLLIQNRRLLAFFAARTLARAQLYVVRCNKYWWLPEGCLMMSSADVIPDVIS